MKTNQTPFELLEQSVFAALETYSNVHRGKGQKSQLTTHLFEIARNIVLKYLGLNKSTYHLIFSTHCRAEKIIRQFNSEYYQQITSEDIGLNIGVVAIAIKKSKIPKNMILDVGGGTARLVSKEWVISASSPYKFEAGTPAIINVIAFAKGLQLIEKFGKNIFKLIKIDTKSVQAILEQDEFQNLKGIELLAALRSTIVGKNIMIPTAYGEQQFINFDSSASTPAFLPVWKTFTQSWGHSSSLKNEIPNAVKGIIGNFFGASSTAFDVFFSSNATEAINTVSRCIPQLDEPDSVILNTLLEHSSNDIPWRMLTNSTLLKLTVDKNGFVNNDELEGLLNDYNVAHLYGNKRIKLFAVSGASNVLGTCNNLKEMSEIVHKYNVKLLVDASQLAAHRKINIEDCGIDYLVFSGHKIYSPFGCGALVARKGLLNLDEALFSSQNIAGIAALGKSLTLMQRVGMDVVEAEEREITRYAIKELAKISAMKMYGINSVNHKLIDQKLGVLPISFTKMMAHRVAKELALRGGIGVRSGCHCAHIIVKHILGVGSQLEKIQQFIASVFPKVSFPGVVRVSIGVENTKNDIDKLVRVLIEITTNTNKSKINSAAYKKRLLLFIKVRSKMVFA